MLRLFVALRPPLEMRQALIATMHGVAGARWQSDAQLHLTLSFLDELSEEWAETIDRALAYVSAPAVHLAVSGVGAFARAQGPTALLAETASNEELDNLARKVRHALRHAGAIPDRRAFKPHITLARLNRSTGPIDHWLAANGDLAIAASPIDRFGLYESRLGSDGSSYHLLADYPLG
jgi:RNA 2',3'-cyclic 3'-phosphodiesterase